MAIVTLKINNRDHQVACPDGEEDHLQNLGNKLSEKIESVSKSYPNANELTLYMMAGLMICDELDEHKNHPGKTSPDSSQEVEEAVAKTINMITEHLEYIANKINK